MVDSETKTPLVLGADGAVAFYYKELFPSSREVTNQSLVDSTRWFSSATVSDHPPITAKATHSVRQKRQA